MHTMIKMVGNLFSLQNEHFYGHNLGSNYSMLLICNNHR